MGTLDAPAGRRGLADSACVRLALASSRGELIALGGGGSAVYWLSPRMDIAGTQRARFPGMRINRCFCLGLGGLVALLVACGDGAAMSPATAAGTGAPAGIGGA